MRRQIRKRALKTLAQMEGLVQYVQPEKKGLIQGLKQNQGTLLKEITTVHGGSRYEELVERVCDDLIENVNNQIDLYKKEQDNPEGVGNNQLKGASQMRPEFYSDKPQMRTDNTMMKPQLAWWANIDNSYYPFIPLLDGDKPHASSPIPVEIVKAAQDKTANPTKYRQIQFGDHKIQKDRQLLPHPYKQEIEDFDFEVKDKEDFQTSVTPQKYKGLDEIPFLFVETEE